MLYAAVDNPRVFINIRANNGVLLSKKRISSCDSTLIFPLTQVVQLCVDPLLLLYAVTLRGENFVLASRVVISSIEGAVNGDAIIPRKDQEKLCIISRIN